MARIVTATTMALALVVGGLIVVAASNDDDTLDDAMAEVGEAPAPDAGTDDPPGTGDPADAPAGADPADGADPAATPAGPDHEVDPAATPAGPDDEAPVLPPPTTVDVLGVTETPAQEGQLPATGTTSALLVAVGVACLVTGGAATAATRRR